MQSKCKFLIIVIKNCDLWRKNNKREKFFMINNIIFDFDGVLVDSEIIVGKAFSKYLAGKNIFFTEKEFSQTYAGNKTMNVV